MDAVPNSTLMDSEVTGTRVCSFYFGHVFVSLRARYVLLHFMFHCIFIFHFRACTRHALAIYVVFSVCGKMSHQGYQICVQFLVMHPSIGCIA